ncbi:hypothetical protein UFOVP529_4 [uncultured Caudovirales phage]|uniref:Uncharacterized protein n=1 Tax=uncultured Caudovirales phage TaxID=2100421 RepID=A0A6J5R1A1_9CAUD|nr:hypothetical protein UFOVP529_4 [uncultured Caudovirales phage]CAB4190463.1 hypothetical protein UFOVP1191_62 [uncultured Caudovirales phage]CAB4194541.1 hypothetical protein UFOVP1252_116 [uncultured Caudovirales phage]
MLTLGSGVLEVAYWVSGRAKGTSSYFGVTGGGYTSVFTIGQIAGDVEFDINYQEREFYGQYNFPIAKAHFGGKVGARARRVELNVNSLKNFFNANGTASFVTAEPTGSFVFDPDTDGGVGANQQVGATTAGAGLPRPLYVRFTHSRSDDSSKTVKIHLPKAYTNSLNIPFTREDIIVQDIDFMAVVDTSLVVTSGGTAEPTIVLIEA